MNKTNFMKYIFVIVFLLITITGFSQMMGPQEPGGGPEASDPPIGGGAPVSSGTIILLSLGLAYGGKKVIELRMVKSG